MSLLESEERSTKTEASAGGDQVNPTGEVGRMSEHGH